ncbi:hypothetical protein RI054_23g101410 [Pseudoscourfieldia marina]
MATAISPSKQARFDDAVTKAEAEIDKIKAALATRVDAFRQDVPPASAETEQDATLTRARDLADKNTTAAAVKTKARAFLGDVQRLDRALAAAEGKLEGVRARPPTPAKLPPQATESPQPTLPREIDFYGVRVMVDTPAQSSPDTPALLQRIRASGKSKVLSMMSDDALLAPSPQNGVGREWCWPPLTLREGALRAP